MSTLLNYSTQTCQKENITRTSKHGDHKLKMIFFVDLEVLSCVVCSFYRGDLVFVLTSNSFTHSHHPQTHLKVQQKSETNKLAFG